MCETCAHRFTIFCSCPSQNHPVVSQDFEKKFVEVLQQSFAQCLTVKAQLRLLEVFQGVSQRETVRVGFANEPQLS